MSCAGQAQQICSSTIFSQTHLFQNKYIYVNFKIFFKHIIFKNANFVKRKVALSFARQAQQISFPTIISQTHPFQNKYTFVTFKICLNNQFSKMRIS